MRLYLRSIADLREFAGILGDAVRGLAMEAFDKIGETIADLGGDDEAANGA